MIARRALALAPAALALASSSAQAQPPPAQPAPWGAPPPPAQPAPWGAPPMGAAPNPAPYPGPMPPSGPPPSATEQDLDRAKRLDSGRRLEWVWLDAQGGFEQLGLGTFSGGSALAGGRVPTSSSGGVIGAGLGVRLLFFTLGARGRLGFFDSGMLGSVGGEAGLRLPIGRLEPHFELGAGYASFARGAARDLGIHGYYARLGGGLDYYVSPFFSVGGALSGELLGLSRPSASSLGGALAVTAGLGLHL